MSIKDKKTTGLKNPHQKILELKKTRSNNSIYKLYGKLEGDSKRLNHECQFVDNNGDQISKFMELKELLYVDYRFKREKYVQIHDYDSKRFAIKATNEFCILDFKVGKNFLNRFKQKRRIFGGMICHQKRCCGRTENYSRCCNLRWKSQWIQNIGKCQPWSSLEQQPNRFQLLNDQ